MNIIWKGSPNFDKNRKPITKIVIHWFGMGTLDGANATFQKPGGTSAHYGISDSTVYQWVKEEHVAYHAGNYAVNQESIGIEHDANPDKPLSEQSYQTSGELIAQICARHNIPLDRQHIIKHSEVPRATQCPGTIDLDKLINIAKGGSMPDDDARLSRDHYWNVLREISLIVDDEIHQESDVDRLAGQVKDIKDERDRLRIDKKALEEQKIELADALKECEAGSVGSGEPPEITGWKVNGLVVKAGDKEWNYQKE